MKYNYLMVLLLKMIYERLKHLINFLLVFSLRKLLLTLPSLHIDHFVDPVGLPVISTELICSKLRKLDSYKSPGPDGWPLWALKETADSICIPLSILYSRSLDTGVLARWLEKGSCDTCLQEGWAVVVQTIIIQLH